MNRLIWIIAALQSLLALRVFSRMARTAGGERIEAVAPSRATTTRLAVIVPVLNEAGRIGPCLESLRRQTRRPDRIIVVDGGSTDGTLETIRALEPADRSITLIDASPVPAGVNGKAYGLAKGLDAIGRDAGWVLTVDADVRLHADAIASILSFAETRGVRALSIASTQRVEDAGLALVHPAMLTTLVYRFGIPGHATSRVPEVQANGQCFLIDRALLDDVGGFRSVLTSLCEDVTLARAVAARGEPVGFYEGGSLVDVEMYRDAAEAWRNWPRSLPMRDRYSGWHAVAGMAQCLLVQAAPLWLLAIGLRTRRLHRRFRQLQGALLLGRLGVLAGTARAYPDRPWTYWLSPALDLPVTLEIIRQSRRRSHLWRGRTIVAGEYQ